VVSLRRLDMPLARVAEILAAPTTPERAGRIEAYWAEVESRVAGQRHLTSHLIARLTQAEGSNAMYEIHERDVAEQQVLAEQHHTTVAGLPDFISGAMDRLHRAAQDRGLRTGRPIVVYHGEVTEDSDGPVGVCVPVLDAEAAVPSARVEPARREAYAAIPKAQVEYPQIMSAYEAVEKWTRDHGREVVGAPREVYVEGYDQLGPDDHACDIAFPVSGSRARSR